jgi:hypothetical protein
MRLRAASVVPLLAAGLLLAGCVPQAASGDPTSGATRPASATPEPAETPASGPAVLPDLGGAEVFTIEAVITPTDGDRVRYTMTVYIPLETGTSEAQDIDAVLRRGGDEVGVWDTAVAAQGVVQYVALSVDPFEGGFDPSLRVPVTFGLGAQDTISGIPGVSVPGTPDLALTGSGTGFAFSALTGAGPVSTFDWAGLALQYGFLEGEGYTIDACDVTTTEHAADYAPLASWVTGDCTFGAF